MEEVKQVTTELFDLKIACSQNWKKFFSNYRSVKRLTPGKRDAFSKKILWHKFKVFVWDIDCRNELRSYA